MPGWREGINRTIFPSSSPHRPATPPAQNAQVASLAETEHPDVLRGVNNRCARAHTHTPLYTQTCTHAHTEAHVHTNICTHTHRRTHTYTHKHVHMCTHRDTYAHTIHTNMCTRTDTHKRVHMHIQRHARTHIHTNMYTCTYIGTCTHTHMQTHKYVHTCTYRYAHAHTIHANMCTRKTHTNMYTCTYRHTCTQTCTHAHRETHIHTSVYTHAHTETHTYNIYYHTYTGDWQPRPERSFWNSQHPPVWAVPGDSLPRDTFSKAAPIFHFPPGRVTDPSAAGRDVPCHRGRHAGSRPRLAPDLCPREDGWRLPGPGVRHGGRPPTGLLCKVARRPDLKKCLNIFY